MTDSSTKEQTHPPDDDVQSRPYPPQPALHIDAKPRGAIGLLVALLIKPAATGNEIL